MSDSLSPHGYSPWKSLGQNTGVGSLSLLQGIFPTQESKPPSYICRQVLYTRTTWEAPQVLNIILIKIKKPNHLLGSIIVQLLFRHPLNLKAGDDMAIMCPSPKMFAMSERTYCNACTSKIRSAMKSSKC